MLSRILEILASGILWFALHVEEKNIFPKPLPPSQELELFKQYAKGDKSAKDKLILHNLRLVAHIVKKYSNQQDVQDELTELINLHFAFSFFEFVFGEHWDLGLGWSGDF